MNNSTHTSAATTSNIQKTVWHVVELSLTMTPENPSHPKQCDDYDVHIVGEPHEIMGKIHQWLENEFEFPPGIESVEVDSMHVNVIVRDGRIAHSLASVAAQEPQST